MIFMMNWLPTHITTSTILFLLLALTSQRCLALRKPPRFDIVNPDEGYHGIVKENERIVTISPRIRAVDTTICGIEIVNNHGHNRNEIPFDVRIVDSLRGEGILEAKRDINCEKRRSYKFDIRAIGCNGLVSENATVHITVEDENEYAPQFKQESYTVTVNEGRIIDPIIQVEAVDRDCSTKYNQICRYEIIGSDQRTSPFEIDALGNIKNTRPLDWSQAHNYILEVVAYDCEGKRSRPALVNIKVNKVCRPGWKEIADRVEYVSGSGARILFPDAELNLCEAACEPANLTVSVKLATRHIGKGCDRDTYSVESQRKLCGASDEAVDLLPSPGLGADWTRDLPMDEGRDSDQIYQFDGTSNAVVIPPNVLNHNLTDTFSVSFWMRHEPPLDHTNKHIKEHIICNADDHKKNRHHLALFIRNCRLILLLRREATQEKHTVFRPAEWRWKIAQVCDNEWHHYSVNVKFPDVELYIDGVLFKNTSTNPEIVDDWPLHGVKGVNTTLVVGGCWQGRSNAINFHFRGFLAGLSVLHGATETPETLQCLHRCKEGLVLPPADSTDPGTELRANLDSTEVVIDGRDPIDVEDMLSQVAYSNSREFPTPGRRSVRISTSIQCIDGKSMRIPSVDSYVMVLQADEPSITLNGTPNLAREYEAFLQGIQLFSTVSVNINRRSDQIEEMNQLNVVNANNNNVNNNGGGSVSSSSSNGNDDDDIDGMVNDQASVEDNNVVTKKARESGNGKLISERKLDACMVQVYPPLNPDHEYFRLPVNFMAHLGVHHKETKDGILITGADTVHNYEAVLREIIYFNRKPAYYLNRAFKLTCSELNGRFVSNDYIQTLTVIHPKSDAPTVSQPQAPVNDQTSDQGQSPAAPSSSASSSSPIGQQQQPVAHLQAHDHKIEFKEARIKSAGFLDGGLIDASDALGRTSASHAVTIIIVVCVGFLVFMIVLGVIRIRAAHHRTTSDARGEDEQEMAWDDSSLTITVNPLDQIQEAGGNSQIMNEEEDEDSSDDDGSSYHEEDAESSDEELDTTASSQRSKSRGDLEWDDSTLNF